MVGVAKSALFLYAAYACSIQSLVHGAGGQGSWSYSPTAKNGPSHWGSVSSTCGGNRQSPINIETSQLRGDPSLKSFVLYNFDSNTGLASSYLKNNGHTVQVDLPSSDYFVEGGGLGRTYKVAQFHFHWGSTAATGSEHTINSKSYPMEVHFVTYAIKYGDIGTAVTQTDGLAVLGFFFQVEGADNPNWAPIISRLNQVIYADTNTSLPTNSVNNLVNLLPSNRAVYYRYSGSLTTPNCNEVVTWSVFKEPIKISAGQMNMFRNAFTNTEGSANSTMSGNYRPVQSLAGRIVYTASSGHAHLPTSGIIIAAFVSLVFVRK